MRLIDNRSNLDPAVNLALEEYAVRRMGAGERYLLLYVNDPAIIIGKHQNTAEEVNADAVARLGLHVVRRISGGGAVYHDHGNLNFSFITDYRQGSFLDFRSFTEPVVRVLQELGVGAELTGRNDIVVDGRKISGNAQFTTAARMFSHGTLLFDSDLDRVQEALAVKPGKVASKGVKSVRARVANIREFLRTDLDLAGFRERLVAGIFGTKEPPLCTLAQGEWEEVERLAAEKYRRWEWNYGESPACNIQRVRRFPEGEVDARIDVQSGRIVSIRIYGDFLGSGEMSELEAALAGVRHTREDVAQALAGFDIVRYFGGLAPGPLVELLAG